MRASPRHSPIPSLIDVLVDLWLRAPNVELATDRVAIDGALRITSRGNVAVLLAVLGDWAPQTARFSA